MTAHPGAPAVFVWDTGWLIPSSISMKRVQFIAECLLEMPGRIELRVGEPAQELLAAAQAVGADYIVAQSTPGPTPSRSRGASEGSTYPSFGTTRPHSWRHREGWT